MEIQISEGRAILVQELQRMSCVIIRKKKPPTSSMTYSPSFDFVQRNTGDLIISLLNFSFRKTTFHSVGVTSMVLYGIVAIQSLSNPVSMFRRVV